MTVRVRFWKEGDKSMESDGKSVWEIFESMDVMFIERCYHVMIFFLDIFFYCWNVEGGGGMKSSRELI